MVTHTASFHVVDGAGVGQDLSNTGGAATGLPQRSHRARRRRQAPRELDEAVREFLAWRYVHQNADTLGLGGQQTRQA